MKRFFITSINTDIGKTFISSILFNFLGEDTCYFKPVQTGCEFNLNKIKIPDLDYVKEQSKIKKQDCFKYSYALKYPLSPHLSCKKTNITIDIEKIKNDFGAIKNNFKNIIVEGAGGVFTPLNENNYFMYNLIKDLNLNSILVTNTEVGTINNTLLTLNHLKNNNIKVSGIIFNKFKNKEHEIDNINFIKNYSDIENILIIYDLKIRNQLNWQEIENFIYKL